MTITKTICYGLLLSCFSCGVHEKKYPVQQLAEPASNIAQDAKYAWLDEGKIGLMVHWGLSTGTVINWKIKPLYTSIASFEKATESWSADSLVEEAKKIRAKYIVFASFHCGMGYLRAWRSEIPGTPVTHRDYLGELIGAAHRQGIKVVMYLTSTLHHYPRYPENIQNFVVDSKAYTAYVTKNNPRLSRQELEGFDLRRPLGDGAFIFENVGELVKNYAVDGFWLDALNHPAWFPANRYAYAKGGWDDGVKSNMDFRYDENAFRNYPGPRDMIQFINDLNPRLLTFVNNFPPIVSADVISHEMMSWTGYDQQDSTTSYFPRNENLLIPGKNDYYYEGTSYPVTPAAEIKKLVDGIGWGINMCLAEGPEITGAFPEDVSAFNDRVKNFFDWASPSLLFPAISGRDGRGFTPGAWSDSAYGVTMFVPGTSAHYLHILSKPAGKTLTVPAGNYRVDSVFSLKTGEALPFVQANRKLTISIADWDDFFHDGVYIVRLSAVLDPAFKRGDRPQSVR